MKTKIVPTLILLSFFTAFSGAKAQSLNAGSTMIGIGVGYSDLTKYMYNGMQPTLELPELSATLDYFVISNYSIGLGVAYQNVSGSGYYNTGYPNYNAQSFNESVTRVNVSVRSLVYFTKDMKPNFYAGVCIGYEYFNYSYSPFDPYNSNNYPYNYTQQPLTAPTIQAFLGVRARITEGFSTYFEVGTGIPFYAEMGFSFNFGGKPEVAVAPVTGGPSGPPPYMH